MLNFIGERSGPLNELQLETVLRDLLDRGSEYGTSGAQVSPEILTLQASAMRLRAAVNGCRSRRDGRRCGELSWRSWSQAETPLAGAGRRGGARESG